LPVGVVINLLPLVGVVTNKELINGMFTPWHKSLINEVLDLLMLIICYFVKYLCEKYYICKKNMFFYIKENDFVIA